MANLAQGFDCRRKPIGRSVPKIVDQFIGGWQTQTVFQNQTGRGLTFDNVLVYGSISDIPLAPDTRSLQRWFNTSVFERVSGQQLAQNIRTFPSRISGARSAGISTVDLSLFKSFVYRDRFRVQIRCVGEGIANHPNFSPPNTTATAANFGQVTNTQTGQEERRISLGLKLMF